MQLPRIHALNLICWCEDISSIACQVYRLRKITHSVHSLQRNGTCVLAFSLLEVEIEGVLDSPQSERGGVFGLSDDITTSYDFLED